MLRSIVKKLTSPLMIIEQSTDAIQVRYRTLNRRIKYTWELSTNSLAYFLSWLSMSEQRDQGGVENTKVKHCEDSPTSVCRIIHQLPQEG